MSLARIVRLNVDSTDLQSSTLQVSLANPIINVPEEYNVVLEKAEIPISGIALDVITDPYYIMIDYPPELPPHPVLEPKINVFTIQGAYHSIDEFLQMVNKIISDDLMAGASPQISGGTFGYDRESSRLLYKFGSDEQRFAMNSGVEIWFDARLINKLDGFANLFDPNRDSSVSHRPMHKLTWSAFLSGTPTGPHIGEQNNYLLDRLYGFKSIRITTTLPTRSYIVYDQVAQKSAPSALLAEIILDSANYQEGRSNQLYVPQNLIPSELMGVTPLTEFVVWIHVHYKSGVDYPLSPPLGDYCSLTLGFYKQRN